MLAKAKVLVPVLAALVLAAPAAGARAPHVSSTEASLLRAINGARTSRGLAPLRLDLRLFRAARGHTADMLQRQYFAHGAVDGRARAVGVRGPVYGENLAWATALTTRWVVGRWLASPRHRAVMLRPGFRRIGIGVAYGRFAGSDGAGVVTADFAGR